MNKFTDFAQSKDALAFKQAFTEAVAAKVVAVIEAKKAEVASTMFAEAGGIAGAKTSAKSHGGKLYPAGVVVKKVTGQTAEGESEHEVLHNGKSLGVISHDWEGNHNAVHALPGHSGEDYSHHSTHHAAVKAILKTHGIKEEVENVEEEKIEMTRGGRATGNAIKDIVAKNNARIAKKKADAAKAEKKKNS